MKMENFCSDSSSFMYFDNKSSSGFMELLGLQDFGNSFGFDDFVTEELVVQQQNDNDDGLISAVESSFGNDKKLVPATPNSSSVSSVSCEVINEQEGKVVNENEDFEQEQHKTKKELKAKKTNQKKQREARFAFMTKSEVDHLEDGYRWRKYGQKAVKNSPFPRSYYRCTSASCGVKKRVERSCNDPTTVMTTYEGQHTHPSPIIPRGGTTHNNPTGYFPNYTNFSNKQQPVYTNIQHQYQQQYQQQYQHQQQQQPFVHNLSSLNLTYNAATQNSHFYRDNGLLQDIIPSFMPKDGK